LLSGNLAVSDAALPVAGVIGVGKAGQLVGKELLSNTGSKTIRPSASSESMPSLSNTGNNNRVGSIPGSSAPEVDILPGMNRPFRPVNPEYPPTQSVVDAMSSPRIQTMVGYLDNVDCSEIAEKLLQSANGTGKIIEVRPVQNGNLTLYQNGDTRSNNYYHQVYTDGRYVYDPTLSTKPVPYGDWEQHIRGMNPSGVTISDERRGLR
jgi:filamentous hemagglutinin